MSDGWTPRITDDEWRAHQASLWATETDTRLKSITSGAWDLEADQRIASLSTLPSLDSYAGNELRDQAGPAPAPTPIAPAAAPAADWSAHADARIAGLGSDFLPAGGVGEDLDRISAPLPALRAAPQRPVEQEGAPSEQQAYDAVGNPGFQGDLPDFAALDRITSEPPQAQVTGHRFADAVGNASRWLQEHVTFDPFKRFVSAAGPRAEETLHRMADETNPLAGGLDVMNLVTAVPMAGALHGLGLPDAPLAPGVERDTPLLGGLTNPTEALSQILGPGELVGAGRGLGRLATGAARHLGTGALEDALRNLPKYGEAALAGLSDELAPARSAASGVIDIPNRVPRPQMRESLALFEPSTGRFITPLEGELEHEDMLARLQVQGVQLREPLHLSFTKDPNMVTIAPEGDPGPTRWRAMAEKAMDRLASGFGDQADDWLVHVVDPQGYNWLGRVGDGIDGLHVPGRPQTAGTFGIIDGAPGSLAGSNWDETSFVGALRDPAKRSALLRGVLGDAPTGGELLTSRAGAAVGGGVGAAQGDEDDTLRDRTGKVLTGVAVGALAGRNATRAARALGRIHASGLAAAGGDPLRLIADAVGVPATNAKGDLLPRAERLAAVTRQLSLPDFGEIAAQLPAEEHNALIRTSLRASDALGTYARLNLLLSPLTHLRNVTTTAATMPWQLAEGALAPVLEPVWRALGHTGEARYLNEPRLRAAGWSHALAAAGRNFADVLAHGDEALEAAQTGRVAKGRVESVLAKGFRPLSAMDALFKTIYEGGELYAQAYRRARSSGLKGAELGQETLRLIQEPDADLVQAVEKAAKYHTFNQDPKRATQLLQKLGNAPIIGPTLLPFVRTPLNAIKYDLERSPLGLAHVAAGAVQRTASSGEMADRSARAVLGSGLAILLYQQAASGNITGAAPASQAEKDAWNAERKKPWSIRVGDSWYDLRTLPGLGATVGVAAAIADAQRRVGAGELDWAQAAGRYSLHVGRVLAQKPLLDNLTQLLGAFDNPEGADRWFEQQAASAASQYAPGASLGRYVEGIVDPVERDARGILERLKANYPGLAGQVPARRTAFGAEVTRSQTGLEAAVNPFRRSAIQPGVRQYVGSTSAEQDAAISRAVRAVQAWERDRRNAPTPTAEQRRLARLGDRENPRYDQLRSRERDRQRAVGRR